MAAAPQITQVFVAIGSNVDAPERMRQAARAIRQRFADARFSRCFRNPAFGFEGPDFYNAVAGFSTTLPIEALLPSLREIETRCGRGPADARWGPRKMDLDLLLYGDLVGSGNGYTLPRRDLLRRVYMLGPMADLAPDWRYPPSGPTIGQLWQRFPQSGHRLTPLPLDLNAA
ncbi:MAG TPA: 2-amino-4-hydroxy-6-hydroxymethyldihydropteridine diphosphokinase [Steroidobacteraceae bacterium]|jgi:2-amino-4-hydroxy-6-hydroxymethyldihydropteridine diphosphokinase|nr:2-amino-4-hydroxy-6-hydroxymethyldihydropteridine diphosphokinase [Steroidobacteraceae bacterium]